MVQKRILLLEDDHIQRDYVKDTLEKRFRVTVATLSCEKSFIDGFEAIATAPPDLAILDVMLMWARPSREASEGEGHTSPEEAGVRCAERFLADPRTLATRVVLYSVFPEADIVGRDRVPGVPVVVKEPDCENLIDAILGMMG